MSWEDAKDEVIAELRQKNAELRQIVDDCQRFTHQIWLDAPRGSALERAVRAHEFDIDERLAGNVKEPAKRQSVSFRVDRKTAEAFLAREARRLRR